MGKFEGFEDIGAWQKAYTATMRVYQITENGRFARDFGLRDQIRRASVSVMANIAEGHGRRSNAESANFLNVARGSAHEVQSHLYVAKGLGYIENSDFEDIYASLSEVSKMSLALARYLRENQNR
ncbi:MAG TPA: four helix bundle protein [Pyrinomonadaceae bacterium]|jgi:four helix bundle protein|nr:four helix bundle protein [Pyrinomonadaceae bacterium]